MDDHTGYTMGIIVGEDIKKEVEVETENIKIETPRLQCHVCYKYMGHRSSLYKHLKYIHKIEPAHRLPISCREKDCMQSFTFIEPFRRHLAEQHGFNITVEKYIFQTMSEFFQWKKATEQEENLRFIVSTGPRNSKGGKTHYYRCQKNGIYKPEIKKRMQSDDGSIYNIFRTHCISSMFVFEEPECVTVEFCRTHYGHELSPNTRKPEEFEQVNETTSFPPQSSLNYEMVDSYSKLNSYLSKKDKEALVNILIENQHLLEETEELFYENEQDVMLKIPFNVLTKVLMEGLNDDLEDSDNDNENENENENEIENVIVSPAIEAESGDEMVVEKLDEEEEEDEVNSNNSAILKSLGNGVFLDPTSNKKLRLDSCKKKPSSKKMVLGSASNNLHETKLKDSNKHKDSNTMFVKEYLNEFDEKVYVLEPVNDAENVVNKREKILSQLQTILMMVNNEEDMSTLEDIEKHLSKYAVAE